MKEILFKKGLKKKLLSAALVLTMVFSMMPIMPVKAAAHTEHSAPSCYYVGIDPSSDRWYAACNSTGSLVAGEILKSGISVFVDNASTDSIFINGVKVAIDPMVSSGPTLTEDMVIDKFGTRSIYLKSMASSHSHNSIDFDSKITSAGGSLSTGNYYLDEDVTLTNNITISGTVNLCLNGHVLKGNGAGRVITVSAGATLNLYDCDTSTVHYFNKVNVSGFWNVPNVWQLTNTTTSYSVTGGVITGGDTTGTAGTVGVASANGAGVYVDGSFTMYGGNIVGNITRGTSKVNVYGAGVYTGSSSSTFTMNGGSIVGNLTNGANSNGAGVYVGSGTFNLNGGRLAENYSGYGAAFGTRNSTTAVAINMTGGTVENNHALHGGGAVFVDGNKAAAVFNMSGGKIINNSADLYNSSRALGGGVFIASTATTFNMSGNAEISGNSAANGGGGIYYETSAPTVNMSDNAKICNNTSNSFGGGVYIQYGGKLIMSGNAEISGNTASSDGGGVCAKSYASYDNSSLVIQGNAKIKNNTSTTNGGGVFVANYSNITVGENAQITGNKKGTATNNVYLTANRTIAISTTNAPSTGMQVGVTTATTPTSGNPVKFVATNGDSTNYKYFVSDKSNQLVVLCNGAQDLTTTDAEMVGCHASHSAGSVWMAVHTHDWKYTVGTGVDANKITAKCEGYDDCSVTDGKTTGVTLSISAPALNYSGSAAAITLTGKSTWEAAGLTTPTIQYEDASGHSLTSAPTAVGTYYATITKGSATAKVQYTIEQAHEADTSNYIHDDTKHWHHCMRLDCTEHKYDSATHTYGEWVVKKLATETEAGEKEHACTVCGYKETAPTSYDKPEDHPEKDPNAGAIENATDASKNGCDADVELTRDEIIDKFDLTAEELSKVENGIDIAVNLEVTAEDPENIPSADKTAAEKKLDDGEKIGQYLDINLFKIIGADKSKVTQINGKITIQITLPSAVKKAGTDYFIIRVHNGVATKLELTHVSGDTYTFETDQFSTYAIGYKANSDSDNDEDVTAPKTGDSNGLSLWFFALMLSLGGALVLGELKRREKTSK